MNHTTVSKLLVSNSYIIFFVQKHLEKQHKNYKYKCIMNASP